MTDEAVGLARGAPRSDDRREAGGSVISVLDGVQAPLARDALELVGAALLEADPRAGHQVLNRARDQHLAGLREGGDASTRMHCDPRHLAVHQLALARVKAGARNRRIHAGAGTGSYQANGGKPWGEGVDVRPAYEALLERLANGSAHDSPVAKPP